MHAAAAVYVSCESLILTADLYAVIDLDLDTSRIQLDTLGHARTHAQTLK